MNLSIATTMKTLNNNHSLTSYFNMSKLYHTGRKMLLAGVVLTFSGTLLAQDPTQPQGPGLLDPLKEAGRTRKFSLGLSMSHLYDIHNDAFNLLSSGFKANDPYGLNGPKTKFDMSAGLTASYYFGPLFSLDLGYEMGKMTGATKVEFYESNVSFLSLSGNLDMKSSARTKEYTWVPFLRGTIARGSYDTERRFINGEGLVGKAKGDAMMLGGGVGVRYHVNDVWSLSLMSEYFVMNTGAWDGYYDVGTGKDMMLKTTLGLKYAFGKGKHMDRKLAWQDNRVDAMEARIDNKVDDAIRTLNDSVANKFKQMMNQPGTKDSDDDGIVDKFDKCPDVPGLFSNNGCPPVEVMEQEQAKIEAVDKKVDAVVEKQIVLHQEDLANTPDTKATKPADAKGKSTATAPAMNAVVTTTPSKPTRTSGGLNNDERYRLRNEVLVSMNPIRFGVGSYQINSKGYEQLNTIAVILRNNPGYSLSLKGFTDDGGSAAFNKKLSEQRANAVMEYLVSRGIDKSRLHVAAMGKDNPLDDNSSSLGRANNRRVECELE